MVGYELPISITINDTEYAITNKGDFRMILDCFSALSDEVIPEQLRIIDCLKIFYEDINEDIDVELVFGENIEEAIQSMYNFFNCNRQNIGLKTNYKLIDWEQDAQLVCAAVNKVAQTEIRSEPYLHWFTFMGMYMSIGESVLSTVVEIRYKKAKGKKLEKYEKEFMHNNPHYFMSLESNGEKEANEEWLDSVWGK